MTPAKHMRPLKSVSLEFASMSSLSLRTTVGTSALRAIWYPFCIIRTPSASRKKIVLPLWIDLIMKKHRTALISAVPMIT